MSDKQKPGKVKGTPTGTCENCGSRLETPHVCEAHIVTTAPIGTPRNEAAEFAYQLLSSSIVPEQIPEPDKVAPTGTGEGSEPSREVEDQLLDELGFPDRPIRAEGVVLATIWALLLRARREVAALRVQPRWIETYTEATKLAMKQGQVVGEKSEYYITLQQLERLLAPPRTREQL